MLAIFLDTETNGLNFFTHRVLEIACKVMDVQTGESICEFNKLISPTKNEWSLSDPASLEVNGFTWEEVSQGEPAEAVGKDLQALFEAHDLKRGKAIFVCQNPSFDRFFFSQLIGPDTQEELLFPYHWLDLASMFWTRALSDTTTLPWDVGCSKDKIAAFYNLPPEEKPHRALNGVLHLIACYEQIIGFANKSSS